MERNNSEKKNILKSIIQGDFKEVEKLKKLMKTEKKPIFVMNHLKKGFYSATIEGIERKFTAEEFKQFKQENNVLEIGILYPEKMPPLCTSEEKLM